MTKDVLVTVRGLQMTPDGDDTIEVTTTGKYYEKDGRIMMPVSVQAHHSFVDGLHIGQFAEGLQSYLDKNILIEERG